MKNRKNVHRWLGKLHGCAGDTLVETLAAILIVALSSVMLLSAAAAAANINKQIKEADAEYAEQVSVAESMSAGGSSAGAAGSTGNSGSASGTSSAGTGTLTIKSGSSTVATVDIQYFGVKDGKLLSYALKTE